jgi:hypothetical protein
MITFEIKEQDVLVPRTPHTQQVFALIASYCASLFTSLTSFKRYVINHLPREGTEIFVTGLRNPNNSALAQELVLSGDDLVVCEHALQQLGLPASPNLFENSLLMSVQYMFI